jgi:uncharacterized protein (DUF488 family)
MSRVTDDGTPIEAILEDNKDLRRDVAELKQRMREIVWMCDRAGFTAAARRNAIREIAKKKL